jgi:carbonic anhydrase
MTSRPEPAQGRLARPGSGPTPDATLAALLEGNRRFVTGAFNHPDQTVERRVALAGGQAPIATLLACADSRVSPELIFDQGLGDLFENRVAGNVLDDVIQASLEYGLAELHTPLVMIMGHRGCGAVTATVEAVTQGAVARGHIPLLVERIRPAVESVLDQPGDLIDNGVRANVIMEVTRLRTYSAAIAQAIAQGDVRIVGAYYDLQSGEVSIIA